jgi:hypothetical protein
MNSLPICPSLERSYQQRAAAFLRQLAHWAKDCAGIIKGAEFQTEQGMVWPLAPGPKFLAPMFSLSSGPFFGQLSPQRRCAI